MNSVILLGRLTKDPELKSVTTKNGEMSVVRFSLAVDRRGKDAGADFINCVAWGKTGEAISKYFSKGGKIAVSGRLNTGSYEKDGKKYFTTDVIVDEFNFCESKKEETPQSASDDFMDIPEGVEDELPFR